MKFAVSRYSYLDFELHTENFFIWHGSKFTSYMNHFFSKNVSRFSETLGLDTVNDYYHPNNICFLRYQNLARKDFFLFPVGPNHFSLHYKYWTSAAGLTWI